MNHNLLITQIGLLVLTLSDGLAPFGKHIWNKKLYGEKTYGGSLVFFITSFAICSYFLPVGIYSLSIAILLTMVELFSKKGLDNIALPIATSLIILIYESLFLI